MVPNPIWLVSSQEKETCTHTDTDRRGKDIGRAQPSTGQEEGPETEGTNPADTYLLDFYTAELWENQFLLSDHSVCHTLLQQP